MRMAGPKHRVAILGTGYIAEWHIKALRALRNIEVTAVCDLNVDRAQSFANRHRIAAVYSSIRELLDLRSHDAVHVLVPAEGHSRAAHEILESGVHAFIEKPMCLRSEECEALSKLAASKGVQVGVSHNFLYSPIYERLRRDVASGSLGRLDQVDIVWHKELGLVANGPFDGWMLRSPQNVIFEIGPHSVAHLLDLVGLPEEMSVRATNPIELPTGQTFYRRWRMEGYKGHTSANLSFSFISGFSEHTIHVRGSLASATVDFERNTYVQHRHVGHDYDLDRYSMTVGEASKLRKQAGKTLRDYALSKWTKSPAGSPFGASISASIAAFYSDLGRGLDPRISARMGRDTVATCERISSLAQLSRPEIETAVPLNVLPVMPQRHPKVLVLGATGFIGRELVRQLTLKDCPTRVLVRKMGGTTATFDRRVVEVMQGDMTRPEDLDRALDGITHVYHLARAQAKTYAEFMKNDVEVTRLLAEKCQACGIKRLLYTSSISPYYSGKYAGKITEETPLDMKIGRRNPYARIKAAAEEMLLEMHKTDGLPVVIFRPGIVIGKGSRPFHPGVGLWAWDSICRFWGRGTNLLPIVLVEDVAIALVSALDVPGIEGESFNLVGEPCLTAREFVSEIENHAQIRLDTGPAPIAKFYLADMSKWVIKILIRHPDRRLPSYRDWDSRSQRALYDCSKAKQQLNWIPTTDRSEIIRRGIHEPLAELLR